MALSSLHTLVNNCYAVIDYVSFILSKRLDDSVLHWVWRFFYSFIPTNKHCSLDL